MIQLSSIIKESLNANDWYTGRTIHSTDFNYEHVGKQEANDQEGPGFYFTNNVKDAAHYSTPRGIILQCQIDIKKVVSTTKRPTSKDIQFLIKNCPNIADKLNDYGETFNEGFREAFKMFSDYDEARDCYLTIQHDLYRYEPKEYLVNMVKLGYTGHFATWTSNQLKHFICYDNTKIKIINKIDPKTILILSKWSVKPTHRNVGGI